MNENEKIRLYVMFNIIKRKLSVSLENELYQKWSKTDKKIKFKDYVLDHFKKKIDDVEEK